MNKQVEQIKAEIERRLEVIQYKPQRIEAFRELKDLISFINSLEEPKFKVGDKIYCGDVTHPVTITGMRDDAYFTDSALGVILFSEQDNWELVEETITIRKQWFEHCKKSWYQEGYIDGSYNRKNQFEEPVSKFDSCIQEGDKIVTNEDGARFNISQLERVAVSEDLDMGCGVIWKDYKEPISEDLQKFADEWDESLYRSDAVIAGAKWQKEQMLKDAVDAEVNYYETHLLFFPTTIYQLIEKNGWKKGDRVKLIIVKEE